MQIWRKLAPDGRPLDLSTPEGEAAVDRLLTVEKPPLLCGSPPCEKFAVFQHILTDKRDQAKMAPDLKEARRHVRVAARQQTTVGGRTIPSPRAPLERIKLEGARDGRVGGGSSMLRCAWRHMCLGHGGWRGRWQPRPHEEAHRLVDQQPSYCGSLVHTEEDTAT